MKSSRLIYTALIIGIPFVVWAGNSAGTITVRAERDGKTVTDLTQTGATLVNQVQYVGLEGWTKSLGTNIHFAGKDATPDATVVVMIPDSHISQSATVSDNGEWSVEMPTNSLENGNYYAYVATAEGDDMKDMKPVAYFTVSADEAWSPATWLFIGTGTFSLIALFVAITIQLNYNVKHHPVV